MIKSNELRCGNLVWDNYGGIYKVVNINSEGFDYIDAVKPSFKAIGRYELENIEPIPLTEDWLKRFGFGRLGKYSFRTKHLIIHHRKRGFVINKKIREIQYVHELQNIYWALFNTELTPSDGGKIE